MLTPNYHKLYSLNTVYEIDKDKLKNKYFKLSKKYHPDIVALKYKSIVDGYNTLRDDYKRAVYMYKGKPAELEQSFLSEILELEEEIDKCSDVRLSEIKKYVEKSIDGCKEKYYDGSSLGRWRYYQRLMDKIEGK